MTNRCCILKIFTSPRPTSSAALRASSPSLNCVINWQLETHSQGRWCKSANTWEYDTSRSVTWATFSGYMTCVIIEAEVKGGDSPMQIIITAWWQQCAASVVYTCTCVYIVCKWSFWSNADDANGVKYRPTFHTVRFVSVNHAHVQSVIKTKKALPNVRQIGLYSPHLLWRLYMSDQYV